VIDKTQHTYNLINVLRKMQFRTHRRGKYTVVWFKRINCMRKKNNKIEKFPNLDGSL
jgi:hypothetical protein